MLLSLSACAPTLQTPLALQAVVPVSDLVVGKNRLPIILYDGETQLRDVSAVQIQVVNLQVQPAEAVGSAVNAVSYSEYAVPYWRADVELPSAGYWGVQASITLADGRTASAEFVVEAKASVSMPTVGTAAIASDSPTADNPTALAQITSAYPPNPALYQISIRDALANGKPTIISFATPAYCQTSYCAPVVESLSAIAKAYANTVNVIHVEVYRDYATQKKSAVMLAWGLSTEPWTFVVDGQGMVVESLQGPVAERELREILGWLP
jgi:thiol-disulfide isomerase/thioredoxin